jgi:hypothetical protein
MKVSEVFVIEVTIRVVLDRLDARALSRALLGPRTPAPPQPPAATVRQWRSRRAKAQLAAAARSRLAAVALDGKTSRGARRRDGTRVHLLGVTEHGGRFLDHLAVDAKHNETSHFTDLLAAHDLAGRVVTFDALHTVRSNLDWLVAEKKAHYIAVVKANQCATRRSDISPSEAGQTRREVCWDRWLTWSRKVKGTRACQETGGRVQMPGTARRGTRAVWRRLDCLNPNLQRQQFTATGKVSVTGARRARGVLVRPGQPSRRERCPTRAFKEMSGAPAAALNVCRRRTWDHRPSTAGGDGVPVVVAGVATGQGGREGRLQGEGAQVMRTLGDDGGMRNAESRHGPRCPA